MRNENFSLKKEISLNNEIAIVEDEFEINDEINEISDENCHGNDLSIIKKRYVKHKFFVSYDKSTNELLNKSSTEHENKSGNENINFSTSLTKVKLKEVNNKQSSNKEIGIVFVKNNSSSSRNNNIEMTEILKKIIKKKSTTNWNIILNAVSLILKMKHIQVKRIKTNELESHYDKWVLYKKLSQNITFKDNFTIKNSPTKITLIPFIFTKQYKIYNDEEMTQLEYIAKQTRFFSCIASGTEEYFHIISEIVKNDPNKYIFNYSQKHKYFINQKDENFITALYVATINGHLKIVKFLCENGADHLIKNGVKN